MAKARGAKPATDITFACTRCKVDGKTYTFRAAPARVEEDTDSEHHPWRYFAECQGCGEECEQAAWERALFKAWANATGPKTPEGKAVTAANLKGHPTPEEARRTRFNAMKHGLNARVATYFPAKPDGYSFCASCDVNREWCAEQPACVKRAETFMLHHAAFDQRKPEHLMPIYADMQAAVMATLQMILQTIIADGVKITAPQWYSDKEGGLHLVEVIDEKTGRLRQVMDVSAHPLLKPLAEMMKAAGLSLADMGMTIKVGDAIDDDELGRLRGTAAPVAEDIDEYKRRTLAQMDALRPLLERARTTREQDPVLLEYNREAGTYEAPAVVEVRPAEPAGDGGAP